MDQANALSDSRVNDAADIIEHYMSIPEERVKKWKALAMQAMVDVRFAKDAIDYLGRKTQIPTEVLSLLSMKKVISTGGERAMIAAIEATCLPPLSGQPW